jgi:squalene-hopene/tetraprenyl-beta-curcumene cyclase
VSTRADKPHVSDSGQDKAFSMKAITRTDIALTTALVICFVTTSYSATPSAPAPARNSWNAKAAAAYLDQRAEWWMYWPGAARDHKTFCISCHTALPYALSRSALGSTVGGKVLTSGERRILDNVITRVRLWDEVKPFYGEQVGVNKALQSRGTESVLNALILASFDARNSTLRLETRTAFRNMWALQRRTGDEKGAWPWLNFDNEPFEAKDSVFYGATLAAIAVGTAPGSFRQSPEIQGNFRLMRDYLDREYGRESLSNQAVLLWASSKLPGLLSPQQQISIVDALLSKQQADGGWNLSSFGWTWRGSSLKWLAKLWLRSENTPVGGKSDGYATGMIAYVLEQYGLPRDNAHLQRALDWLARNQSKSDGRWPGYSLNHRREQSPTGLFMSDAATAYAVLALTGCDPH